jgi:hypothetical protein
MNLEWILSPLAIYAAVALTLVISAGLWVGAKVETARLKRTLQDTRKELAASDEARKTLAAKVNDLEGAINRLAEEPVAPLPGPVRNSINLTKRAQVLRMRRRGESVESITAALCVPRNEIELLLKLNEMAETRKN